MVPVPPLCPPSVIFIAALGRSLPVQHWPQVGRVFLRVLPQGLSGGWLPSLDGEERWDDSDAAVVLLAVSSTNESWSSEAFLMMQEPLELTFVGDTAQRMCTFSVTELSLCGSPSVATAQFRRRGRV